jgi:hypothetical protein
MGRALLSVDRVSQRRKNEFRFSESSDACFFAVNTFAYFENKIKYNGNS